MDNIRVLKRPRQGQTYPADFFECAMGLDHTIDKRAETPDVGPSCARPASSAGSVHQIRTISTASGVER